MSGKGAGEKLDALADRVGRSELLSKVNAPA